jgi:hypothetical protein
MAEAMPYDFFPQMVVILSPIKKLNKSMKKSVNIMERIEMA